MLHIDNLVSFLILISELLEQERETWKPLEMWVIFGCQYFSFCILGLHLLFLYLFFSNIVSLCLLPPHSHFSFHKYSSFLLRLLVYLLLHSCSKVFILPLVIMTTSRTNQIVQIKANDCTDETNQNQPHSLLLISGPLDNTLYWRRRYPRAHIQARWGLHRPDGGLVQFEHGGRLDTGATEDSGWRRGNRLLYQFKNWKVKTKKSKHIFGSLTVENLSQKDSTRRFGGHFETSAINSHWMDSVFWSLCL